MLRCLERKGFIEIEKGKPIKYHVIPPREIISNSKKINEILDKAQRELTEIYEDKVFKVPAPIWLIHGPNKIIKKEIEIISRAKKDIKIRAGFLFKEEAEKLIGVVKNLERKGVDVKIMTNSDLIKKNTFDDKIKFTRVPPKNDCQRFPRNDVGIRKIQRRWFHHTRKYYWCLEPIPGNCQKLCSDIR